MADEANDTGWGWSAAAAALPLLENLFDDSPSLAKQKRDTRELIKTRAKYEPHYARAMFTSRMRSAREHKVHPLVALGVNPSQGGGFAGQYGGRGGSGIGQAASMIAQAIANKPTQLDRDEQQARIDLIRNQAAALAQKTPSEPSGITGQNVPISSAGAVRDENRTQDTAGYVKVEPNVQRTRSREDSSVAAGTNPAWMKIELWEGFFVDVPWSEEGFAESMDNLPALVATIARNTGKGYAWVYKKAAAALRRFHQSKDRNMRSRHPKRRKIPPKVSRRRQTTPDIFVPYSRGPHR
jgi:hypothetical protein